MSIPSGQTIVITPECDHPSFPVFFAKPDCGGPGLILITENLDITQEVEQEAITLSQEGYIVLVPDLSAISPDDRDGVIYINGVINHLENMPEKIGKIGIIGRGRGASIAIRSVANVSQVPRESGVTRVTVDCGVAYYPANLNDDILGLTEIEVPFMIHLVSGHDESTKEKLKRLTSRNDLISTFEYSSMESGFASPSNQAPVEVKAARNMAYTRSLDLLRKVMGPHYDLSALWDKHIEYEFGAKDTQKTMETMVADAYVNNIPTMTGGVGNEHLERFYQNHFIHSIPPDTRIIPISRTVGTDRLVEEMIFCFTHTQEIDWLLPGVAPTNKYVEIPIVGVINFRGDKLCNEHIYWDQASVLVQIGILNKDEIPVTGREQAEKLMDKNLPNNELLKKWKNS